MSTTPDTAAQIRQELARLIDHHGPGPDATLLDSPLLAQYVEVVLCRDHWELVLGGMGQEEALCTLAEAHAFHPEVIAAFRQIAAHFPQKMLYTKFCPAGDPGSMYFVILEPWDRLQGPLEALGFDAGLLQHLISQAAGHRICFLLGFQHNEKLGGLSLKAYHLADRDPSSSPQQPFLVSWRMGRNQIDPTPKHYAAKVGWDAFRSLPGWEKAAALGEAIFGQQHEMLQGIGADAEAKAYVFRHDARQNADFSLKSYNYYVEEGNRLSDIGALPEAEKALRHATLFAPHDVDAWNRLGYIILMQGRYLEGIRHVRKAHAMNPRITNLIWIWANPIPEQDAEIARLTDLIATDPQPAWHNARAIYHFHMRNYALAKADLEQALALEPIYAEAHNNLGGVYIKLGQFAEAVKSCTTAHGINRGTNGANLMVAREGVRLELEAAQSPSPHTLQALGKFYYQVDLFEDSERCFAQAETLATPAHA